MSKKEGKGGLGEKRKAAGMTGIPGGQKLIFKYIII
jgi:hypothetical protein